METVALITQADPVLLMPFGLGLSVALVILALANGTFGERAKSRRLRDVRRRGKHVPTATDHMSLRLKDPDSAMPGLDALFKRFLPRREALKNRLNRTGLAIGVSHYLLACGFLLLLTSGAAFFILKWRADIALAVGVACAAALPHMAVSYLIGRRIKNFLALFPEGIDLIVRGLRSGLPISESITNVGEEIRDPVGIEFRRIDQAMRFGQTLEEALWSAIRRIDTPEFKFFVIALSVQRETGGNLAETLENLSDILRRRRQMKLKIKALSGEAKASAWIIGSLPFLMFFLLLMINPGYVMQLFEDTRGLFMVGGGLTSLGMGVAVMMKMVRFEI